jgi:hypothetical protein
LPNRCGITQRGLKSQQREWGRCSVLFDDRQTKQKKRIAWASYRFMTFFPLGRLLFHVCNWTWAFLVSFFLSLYLLKVSRPGEQAGRWETSRLNLTVKLMNCVSSISFYSFYSILFFSFFFAHSFMVEMIKAEAWSQLPSIIFVFSFFIYMFLNVHCIRFMCSLCCSLVRGVHVVICQTLRLLWLYPACLSVRCFTVWTFCTFCYVRIKLRASQIKLCQQKPKIIYPIVTALRLAIYGTSLAEWPIRTASAKIGSKFEHLINCI